MLSNFFNFLKALLALMACALYGIGAKALLFEALHLPFLLAATITLIPVMALGVILYLRAK